MKKDLENQISELKNYDEKPIGIFGARASGKTMFFTVLYGLTGFNTDTEKFSVICNDAATQDYLRENYTYLLDGKLPPRTEVNEITRIIMRYFYNKSNYDLKSLDFAGELIGTISHNDEEIVKSFFERQKRIYEFFANCGGILVFLEPNDNKKECFDRQNEINKLLSMLQKEKGKWGCDIPIGIVITKWDKVTKDLDDSKFIEDEERKAFEYIKNHEIYNNIYNMITGITDHIKVFPLSAFGTAKNGDLPPDQLNKPFNIFPPLVWISKNRDQVWKERIQAVLNNNIPKKDADEIVGLYKENVEDEDLIEQVDESYIKFKNKIRKKNLTIAIFLILIILAFTGKELMVYNEYVSIKNQENLTTKIETIDEFVGKHKDSNRFSKKLVIDRKTASINRIDSLGNDKDHLMNKLTYINQFINEYTDEADVKAMENKRKETELAIKNLKTEDKIIIEYNILMESLGKNLDNLVKYRLCKEFLIKYPNSNKNSEINEESNKYLKLADREKYTEIEKYNKVSVKKDSNIAFEKIEEYLSVEEFTENKKKVEQIKRNLREEYLYQEVTDTIYNFNSKITRNNLKEVSRKCESYLSSDVVGKYKKNVLSYLSQIDDFERGIVDEFEYYVEDTDSILENNSLDIIFEAGNNTYNLNKTFVKPRKNSDLYIGSREIKLGIKERMTLTVYFLDKKGKETKFKPTSLFVEDLNNYISISTSNKKLKLKVKMNKNNFKIKY